MLGKACPPADLSLLGGGSIRGALQCVGLLLTLHAPVFLIPWHQLRCHPKAHGGVGVGSSQRLLTVTSCRLTCITEQAARTHAHMQRQ